MKSTNATENVITLTLWTGWLAATAYTVHALLYGSSPEPAPFYVMQLWIPAAAVFVVIAVLIAAGLMQNRRGEKQMRNEKQIVRNIFGWRKPEINLARSAKTLTVSFKGADLRSRLRAESVFFEWMTETDSHASPAEPARSLVTGHRKFTGMPILLFCLFFSGRANPQVPLKPASNSPLFSQTAVAELSLTAHFEKIRAANMGGNWHEEDRSAEHFWSAAVLVDSSSARSFSARVRARGMSSGLAEEGDFPKLRVELNGEVPRKGTLFKGARKFRINTHVSTHPESELTPMGRLNGELAPFREALAYDLAALVDLAVPATRRARIHYTESSSGEKFSRQALILETDKNLSERYSAKVVSPAEFAQSRATGISEMDSAKIHLFQALIGNDDFILRVDGERPQPNNPLWDYSNVIVLERPDQGRFVAPYDFDLSSFMAGEGRHESGAHIQEPFGYKDEASGFLAMMMASLRARHSRAAVLAAWADIKKYETILRNYINKANVDAEGRAIAIRHMDRFFGLGEVMLGLRVVTRPGVIIYRDGDLTSPLLELRSGTPVKILGIVNHSLRAAFIDYREDLPEGDVAFGYLPQSAPVGGWVEPQFIGWVDRRDHN